MEKRNIGEVITMFLVEGYLDEDDIIPVLKKGTAKMMGEKEEKIFTQPLQKESEWELKLQEKIKENKFVTPSSHLDVEEIKSFIRETLSNREKEIAEEVDKIGEATLEGNVVIGKCPDCNFKYVKMKDGDIKVKETWIFRKVLSIIKH